MSPVKLLVVGAGGRGGGYATFASSFPDKARIVGVAEPRDHYRDTMAKDHAIPSSAVFKDWRDAAARERLADAVLICTQDAMHLEPSIAFARKGYHILLEKPMAPDEESCRQIVAAAKEAGVIFAVCHVMRYTNYTRALKKILDEGRIGTIVSMQHLEPVGYWHQAHSFVRGNWGNEAQSSPMLLAKSCHDLDWIRHIMNRHCVQVQSFGNLRHFRKSEQPPGAADRCLDCSIEKSCPYSAVNIYLRTRTLQGNTGWPVDVLTPTPTVASVTEALRSGPYGRCVYACDNDVVDHQVVNLLFEDGASAAFTMTAFTMHGGRMTRLFGTRGAIDGDGSVIKVGDFLSGTWETIDTNASDASLLGGHGGGDLGLMTSFVDALATNDPTMILSGPDETLESHRMVFAAERSRKSGTVVTM
jgi:predicted dehydrogenase